MYKTQNNENRSLPRDSHACHAHSVLFLPTGVCKFHSRISDALSQALCNLPLAFLADFIAFSCKLHSAFRLDRKT